MWRCPQWVCFRPSAAGEPTVRYLATIYRTIYGVLASYIAPRLAPYRPMLHAMVLGILDFIVSVAG